MKEHDCVPGKLYLQEQRQQTSKHLACGPVGHSLLTPDLKQFFSLLFLSFMTDFLKKSGTLSHSLSHALDLSGWSVMIRFRLNILSSSTQVNLFRLLSQNTVEWMTIEFLKF